MKKKFENAELELVRFGNSVIVTSAGSEDQTDNGDGNEL